MLLSHAKLDNHSASFLPELVGSYPIALPHYLSKTGHAGDFEASSAESYSARGTACCLGKAAAASPGPKSSTPASAVKQHNWGWRGIWGGYCMGYPRLGTSTARYFIANSTVLLLCLV